MFRKFIVSVTLLLGLFSIFGSHLTQAQAKSLKVLSDKKVKPGTYAHYKNRKSYVWKYLPKSVKKTKASHNLWHYKKMAFKVTRKAKVSKIGTFYQIKSTKFSGWINSKDVKLTKKPSNTTTVTNSASFKYDPLRFENDVDYVSDNDLMIPDGLKGKTYFTPNEVRTDLFKLRSENAQAIKRDKPFWLNKVAAGDQADELEAEYDSAVETHADEAAEADGDSYYDDGEFVRGSEADDVIYTYSTEQLEEMKNELSQLKQEAQGVDEANELVDYEETQQEYINDAIKGKIWDHIFY